jgi:hypothetical protein
MAMSQVHQLLLFNSVVKICMNFARFGFFVTFVMTFTQNFVLVYLKSNKAF